MKKMHLVLVVFVAASLACQQDLVALATVETVPDLGAIMPTQATGPQATPVAPAGGQVCVGPAILETLVEGKAGIIKIDAGETWTWYPPNGNCFGEPYFHGNQGLLNSEFPLHVERYRAKFPPETQILVLEVEGTKLVPYESVLQPQGQAPTQGAPASGGEQPAPGTLAWQQAPKDNGELHPATPIGQLESNLWVVSEVWGPVQVGYLRELELLEEFGVEEDTADDDTRNVGFVVLLPPRGVMWLQGYIGGTGWWLPSDIDPMERARTHQADIEARDGKRPFIIRLPEQLFPLLGCLQTRPVENEIRHCDSVNGLPAFDAPAEEPFPGYFPTPVGE